MLLVKLMAKTMCGSEIMKWEKIHQMIMSNLHKLQGAWVGHKKPNLFER